MFPEKWKRKNTLQRHSCPEAPFAEKLFNDKLDEQKLFRLNDKTEWRLPTLEEAMSLMEPVRNEDGLFINPVFSDKQRWIWTADQHGVSSAWVVYFGGGGCGHPDSISDVHYYV